METCKSIPSHTYNTFLIFNPSDYQTYYFRSECYQKVAIQTGDEKLCDQVKERQSLFLDGSAISREACLTAVKDQKNQDVAGSINTETIHKIEKIEITNDVKGDFYIKIFPTGTLFGTYKITVSLLDYSNKFISSVDEFDTHLSKRNDPLYSIIHRSKIQELIDRQSQNGQQYYIQVSLKLLRDDDGQLEQSNLSPAQLESIKSELISF